MRKAEAYSSGISVGMEEKRGKVTYDNFQELGFVMKCPFGFYYCSTPVQNKYTSRTTAAEKYRTLEGYRNELLSCAAVFMAKDGRPNLTCAKLLRNVNSALLELTYYDANDIILSISDGNGVIERREIKSRLSSFRQKYGITGDNLRNPFTKRKEF